MSPLPLSYFEIQKYYQSKLKVNGVFSRNNLPKIKTGTYLISLNEYKSKGTPGIALYVNGDNVKCFIEYKQMI